MPQATMWPRRTGLCTCCPDAPSGPEGGEGPQPRPRGSRLRATGSLREAPPRRWSPCLRPFPGRARPTHSSIPTQGGHGSAEEAAPCTLLPLPLPSAPCPSLLSQPS